MTSHVLLGATNYQAIIRPLQWFVVIIIFLFFLRVIRAVYVETRPGGKRKERKSRSSTSLSLEIVEPAERAGERYEVEEGTELSLGRSVTCDVAIPDDVYASTLHARFFRDGSNLLIEDLQSTNGTYVNTERVVVPTRLRRGDIVQAGGTIMEVVR